jgi:hypothetical protein
MHMTLAEQKEEKAQEHKMTENNKTLNKFICKQKGQERYANVLLQLCSHEYSIHKDSF